jgi:hypothetical protein
MSVSFCVVFEADVPPHGTLGGDNVELVRAQAPLERLAQANGLRPLSQFESYDAADLAADLDVDVGEVDLPPAQWFPAAEGLTAVQALIAHLAAHPATLSRQPEVLTELRVIAGELEAAAQAGVRFRFALVS